MLKIADAKLRLIKTVPFPLSKRFLKLQLDKSISVSRFPSKGNSKEILWDEELALKYKEGNGKYTLNFQISDKHKFGYDENELTHILYGKAQVSLEHPFHDCEVYSLFDPAPIGYLSLSITLHSPPVLPAYIADPVPVYLQIASIVAHVPTASRMTVFFELTSGQNQARTYKTKTMTGQLVFVEKFEIAKNKGKSDILITLKAIDPEDLENQIILGSGKITIIGRKPAKKVLLYDKSFELIGEAFIDSQIITHDESLTLPSMQSLISEDKIIARHSAVVTNQAIFFPRQQRFKSGRKAKQTRKKMYKSHKLGSYSMSKYDL